MLNTISQLQRDRMAVMSPVVPRWRQGCFWRQSALETEVHIHPHTYTHSTNKPTPRWAPSGLAHSKPTVQPLKLSCDWPASLLSWCRAMSHLQFGGSGLEWPYQLIRCDSSFILFGPWPQSLHVSPLLMEIAVDTMINLSYLLYRIYCT